jgi:hypothetical protein
MSQASTFGVTRSGPESPVDMFTRLDENLDAFLSSQSGTSRPSYAVAGTVWLDTTGTPWLLKQYDGAEDITLARINATDNTVEWVESAEQDLASTTTTDLGSKTGRNLRITGTNTITGFGTSDAGVEKRLRFAASLTLTHNATSLVLPGGANITTAAGDVAVFRSEGSGNWRCVSYQDGVTAKLNAAQTFTAPQKADTLALTHNTAWDGSAKQHLTVDVNGSNFTIANPSAQTAGVYYAVRVEYTTTHTLAWGANFKGVSGITPTATAGAVDHFTFRSDGTNLECVGYALNVAA